MRRPPSCAGDIVQRRLAGIRAIDRRGTLAEQVERHTARKGARRRQGHIADDVAGCRVAHRIQRRIKARGVNISPRGEPCARLAMGVIEVPGPVAVQPAVQANANRQRTGMLVQAQPAHQVIVHPIHLEAVGAADRKQKSLLARRQEVILPVNGDRILRTRAVGGDTRAVDVGENLTGFMAACLGIARLQMRSDIAEGAAVIGEGLSRIEGRQQIFVMQYPAITADGEIPGRGRQPGIEGGQASVIEELHACARARRDQATWRGVALADVGDQRIGTAGGAGAHDRRAQIAQRARRRVGQRGAVAILHAPDQMAAGKVFAAGHAQPNVLRVAIAGNTGLHFPLQAGEVFVEDEIDNAGHGVGAIDGRGAAGDHLHTLHQHLRQHVDIDGGVVKGAGYAMAVLQNQCTDRAQAA
jgi:hypothetical protein